MRFLFFILITFAFLSFAQIKNHLIPIDKNYSSFNFQEVVSNETDISISTINTIFQSSDGYLWIGARLGLFRYNGYNFENFSKKFNNNFLERDINDIIEDSNGILWFGCRRGLVTYKDGKIRLTNIERKLDNIEVLSLSFDKSGTLWIGTVKGLYFISDTSLQIYPEYTKDIIPKVFVDYRNTIWVSINGKGILKIENNKGYLLNNKNGLKSNQILSIFEDHLHNIWFGSYTGELQIYSNDKIKEIPGYDYSKNRAIQSFARDKDNNIWISTIGNGLLRYKDGKFYRYSTKDGLTTDAIKSLFVDKENNLWIGTYGAGLNRKIENFIKTFTVRNGLPNNTIWSIYFDSKNRIWLSTAQSYLSIIDNKEIINIDLKKYIGNKTVRSICEDKQGNLYLGTNGAGIWKYSNNKIQPFLEYNNSNALKVIKSIFEDSKGNLWIGTMSLCYLLQNGKLQAFKEEVKQFRNIRYITEDKKGNIFFCTGTRGLFKLSNNNFTYYDEKKGLFWKDLLSTYIDKDNVHWISSSRGLFRFKDEKFTYYPMEGILKDLMLYYCVEDYYGDLWFSTNIGVVKLIKKELNDYAEGKTAKFQSYLFGKDDGLLSAECNGGTQPAGALTKDGRVWFPTMNGLAVIDPELMMNVDSISPKVVIEKVTVNDSIINSQFLDKTFSNDRIEISYSCLSFKNSAKNEYYYMLEGFDKEWIFAGKRKVAYYNNLLPGDYTFKVMALNSNRVKSNIATYVIHIKPRFYQTFWFYILVSISVIGLGYFIYHHRLKQLELNEKKLSALVEQKTLELSNELKERKQAEEHLRESEERYKFVIEGSNDAYYDWDLRENKVFFGPRWAEILETEYDTIKGSTDTWTNALHPEDKPGVLKKLNSHHKGEIDYFEMEYRIITSKGNIRWIYDRGKVVSRDSEGNPLRISGVMSDITNKRQMENEFFKMKKIESIGILAGGIAHDFNNLLTAILGNISLIKYKIQKNDTNNLLKLLENSEIASLRAKSLTQQLLTFSKGGQPIIKTIQIGNILKECVIFTLRGSNIKSFYDIPENLWLIDADEGQINQVIQNIIINAIQAMPKGGNIYISASNEYINTNLASTYKINAGEYVCIKIQDTGHGIPKEISDKIFDPYFTSKEKGHGLGLATSYSIIKKHKGHIAFDSVVGSGTTFKIWLPKSSSVQDQIKKYKKKIAYGNGNIFLFGNNNPTESLLKEMLENLGYNVETMQQINFLIEKIQYYINNNKNIDLIILNIEANEISEIKNIITQMLSINRLIKIAVIDNKLSKEVISYLKDNNINYFISEPFKIEEISKIIGKIINDNTKANSN